MRRRSPSPLRQGASEPMVIFAVFYVRDRSWPSTQLRHSPAHGSSSSGMWQVGLATMRTISGARAVDIAEPADSGAITTNRCSRNPTALIASTLR